MQVGLEDSQWWRKMSRGFDSLKSALVELLDSNYVVLRCYDDRVSDTSGSPVYLANDPEIVRAKSAF